MTRTILRALGLLLSLLVLAAVVLTLRALRLPSRQVSVPPAPARAVDAERVAAHLAEAIRIPTVITSPDPAELEAEPFRAFSAWLAATYPRLHGALALERVSGHSLLYTWQGSDPALAPLLLLAHQDVVPAGNPERWTHPPFSGAIAEGQVWGRGAIDDKGALVTICEAVEALLAEGYEPRRTVILAFGHDEEVGGPSGAVKMAERLAARGVRPALVLDEGYVLLEPGTVPGFDGPVAPIGVAEKGYATLAVVARAAGGHSSTPPRRTATGALARAITQLEEHPFPISVGGVTGSFFAWLAPELPLPGRVALANADLLAPLLSEAVRREPGVNALLRTTTAVTMLSGSPKENVLPVEARALVNFRILPGETGESVLARVRETVAAPDVEARFEGEHRDPSPVSPSDGPAFTLLQRTIGELFPGAVVAPALVVGGTDARSYHVVADAVYRFGPFRFGPADIKLPHGIDERIAIDNLGTAVRFYARLIENASL
ncbi:MAG: M20 family peptidase [Deltaproteobacteria bacterium]|nr:M20 family peptidase [Deltaproteobacteria bacterium]